MKTKPPMASGRAERHARGRLFTPGFLTLLLLSMVGCATVDPQPSFDRVAAEVADRAGHEISWSVDPADQAAVRDMLDQELSLENAVRVALISSPALQAQYQDLGIAEAGFVQAGLLSNPVFAIEYREGGGEDSLDLHLGFDFLDVFLIPIRKRQAKADQRAAELRVVRAVLMRVSEVRQAWTRAVAARQRMAFVQQSQALLASLDGLAEALWQAGNITRLDRDQARRRMLENKLMVDRVVADEASAIEHLAVVMGTWGDIRLELPDALPPLPQEALQSPAVENLAVNQSLELAAMRSRIESAAAALDLTDRSRLIPTLEAGWVAEREGGEWSDGPAAAFALPILDTGKAAKLGRNAELEQARRAYLQLEIEIRAAARQLERAEAMEREAVLHLRDTVLPLSEALNQEARRQFFASQFGIDDVLLTRLEHNQAYGMYVDALAAYWLTRESRSVLLQGVMAEAPIQASPARVANPPADREGGH